MNGNWLVDQQPKTVFLQFKFLQKLLRLLNISKFPKKINLFSGDMIPKEDVFKLLEQLAGEEDEDGFIPYVPFIDKLCGKA